MEKALGKAVTKFLSLVGLLVIVYLLMIGFMKVFVERYESLDNIENQVELKLR